MALYIITSFTLLCELLKLLRQQAEKVPTVIYLLALQEYILVTNPAHTHHTRVYTGTESRGCDVSGSLLKPMLMVTDVRGPRLSGHS